MCIYIHEIYEYIYIYIFIYIYTEREGERGRERERIRILLLWAAAFLNKALTDYTKPQKTKQGPNILDKSSNCNKQPISTAIINVLHIVINIIG